MYEYLICISLFKKLGYIEINLLLIINSIKFNWIDFLNWNTFVIESE